MRPSLVAVLLLGAVIPIGAASAQENAEPIDIARWHEEHPVSLVEEHHDDRLRIGLYPRFGLIAGIPNGVAGTAQIALSFRRPERYGIYLGTGYEYGPSVTGANVTLGWGGVRETPASAPQNGFSGAFLRYRKWNSDQHGRHDGLSIGFESGLGAFGLTVEAGLARSTRNHWIPVARIGISVGRAWLWIRNHAQSAGGDRPKT